MIPDELVLLGVLYALDTLALVGISYNHSIDKDQIGYREAD
jgi:hypothetical protein